MKFTPEKKLRLWIAGDSLSSSPASRCSARSPGTAVDAVDAIDGRIASGLERPDVFNWFTHVREVMEKRKPRAVVLMFGGNDDHGFMTGIPEGATSALREPDVARRVPPPRGNRDGHGHEQGATSSGSASRSRAMRTRRCAST